MHSSCNQLENWTQHATNEWISKVWAGIMNSRFHNKPLILLIKSWHIKKKNLKVEAIEEMYTKVVGELLMSEILVERTASTYLVDQNRTKDTFSISDLVEIRDWRADQEPEINIRDCIRSGVSFLYSLIIVLGSWNSYLVRWV